MPKKDVPAQAGRKRKTQEDASHTTNKRSKGEKPAKGIKTRHAVTEDVVHDEHADGPGDEAIASVPSLDSTHEPQITTLPVDASAEQKRLKKEAKKARRQQAKQAREQRGRSDGKPLPRTSAPERQAATEVTEQAGSGLVDKREKKSKKRRKENKRITADTQKEVEKQSAKPTEHTVATKRKGSSQQDRTLSSTIGGRFLPHDPAFVRDEYSSAFLLAAKPHELEILSFETSLVERTISAPEGTTVRCFCPDSANEDLVHVVYGDDQVQTWSWSTGISQGPPRSRNGKPVAITTALADDGENAVQFYVSDMGQHSAVSSSGGRPRPLFVSKQHLSAVQALGDSDWVVAHGTSAIAIGKSKEGAKEGYTWIELPVSTPITCLDARLLSARGVSKKDRKHQGLSLAVGNAEGQIHLYDDVSSLFTSKEKPSLPPPRVLHWHREAVSSVKFSRDGNYIISGGKETTLVLWQLETGKKQFLPHLTSDIERVVVNSEGDRYALQMGDNSIMVLSTSELKPVANFAGLQLSTAISSNGWPLPVAAIMHPKRPNEILLTVPSTQSDTARPFLQTFDFRTNMHVTRQALTRNNVTDINIGPDRTPIVPPDVVHVAISSNGRWLATIDEWMPPASDVAFLAGDEMAVEEERRKRREVYLKFWLWDEAQSLWTLSTRVDSPHARSSGAEQGAGKILALTADPSAGEGAFATIGEDSCVKVWKPKKRKRHGQQADLEPVDWVCKGVVHLEHEPDDESDSGIEIVSEDFGPTGACLAYSEDGSMLAASGMDNGTQSTAPLVHFISTADYTTLSREGIAAMDLVDFGFLDCYFIAVSSRTVRVWDLVNDSLQYHFKLPSPANEFDEPLLAINHHDGTYAIAVPRTKEGTAFVEVREPQKAKCLHHEALETPVAAVVASSGGYTLLFSDATVRTLMPASLAPAAALSAAEPLAQGSIEEVDTEMELEMDMPGIEAASPLTQGPQISLEDSEDDRPVVRPEQLAAIFEGMPPVRDMLHAVIELYSRKPRL